MLFGAVLTKSGIVIGQPLDLGLEVCDLWRVTTDGLGAGLELFGEVAVFVGEQLAAGRLQRGHDPLTHPRSAGAWPRTNLSVLPEGAPFAYERLVASFGFLVDADRYAEGNNPSTATNCWSPPRRSPRRP